MHKLNDTVKVIDGVDEDSKLFIGQVGRVLSIYEENQFPYYVEFYSKVHERLNDEIGGVLWRGTDLEGI